MTALSSCKGQAFPLGFSLVVFLVSDAVGVLDNPETGMENPLLALAPAPSWDVRM